MNIKHKMSVWYFAFFAVLLVIFSTTAFLLLSDNLKSKTIHPWEMQYGVIEEIDGEKIISGFSGTPNDGLDLQEMAVIAASYRFDELTDFPSENGYIRINDFYIDESVLNALQVPEDYLLWFYTDIDGDLLRMTAVSRSPNDTTALLDSFRMVLIIAGSLTLILACIGGYFLIRYNLKPVNDMANTVRDIAEHNLDARLEYDKKDELGNLASTFNIMLKRLQNAFAREREFTADASHQLRTPLSVIQGEASLSLSRQRSADEYRTSLENIYEETERIASILKQLLFLARYENHGGMETMRIDLKGLLDELTSDIEVLCEEKSIRCSLTVKDNLFIRGNETSLREMFFNIIENAIRYTDEGGTVSVDLTDEASNAVVTVSDTGIGIPEEALEHVFDRFYRVDQSGTRRKGSGLGLAISRRIAEFHNGSISVESNIGEGSRFSIRLPLII